MALNLAFLSILRVGSMGTEKSRRFDAKHTLPMHFFYTRIRVARIGTTNLYTQYIHNCTYIHTWIYGCVVKSK